MRYLALVIAFFALMGPGACPGGSGGSLSEGTGDELEADSFEETESVAAADPIGDGIGPKGDTTAIPEQNSFFVTMPGLAENFEDIPPQTVSHNLWFIDGDSDIYEQTATARLFHRQIYNEGTVIPENPYCPEIESKPEQDALPCYCRRKAVNAKQFLLECEGIVPQVHGQRLRLIICGQPNIKVIAEHAGTAKNPLAEFIDRAFVRGGDPEKLEKLWDLPFCSERTYVDYTFNAADLQLRFPLEKGKLYFIASFPRDYIGREAEFGLPNPNELGSHSTRYENPRDMGRFLYEGRILQAIQAIPRRSTTPQEPYYQFSYSSADSPEPRDSKFKNELPNTPYCDAVTQWTDEQIALEQELFALINEYRWNGYDCGSEGQKGRAAELEISPALLCAARVHSQDMHERNFVSHTNPDQWTVLFRTLGATLIEQDKPLTELFSRFGENIVQGPLTAQEALDSWLANDRHCANLMNPYFSHMGIAFHPGNGQGGLWTLTLGTRWN